jgi:hypothetical protein
MPKKPKPVSFRLPDDIREAAKKAAADYYHSLSSLIVKVLAEWLQARGYLK